MWCMFLGTFRLNESLLVLRAEVGLPSGPFEGLNSTPCMETPDKYASNSASEANPSLTFLFWRTRIAYLRFGLHCFSLTRHG